ncbi:hypothetical protein P5654_014225 [Bacillus safensis]|uniref:hypothetical protein n=1 Tax=Bacillus safensis TaxID=561879 RepID=UPI002481B75A|nr:hypothetical protein [Bacillus safensis]MDI0190888.1 hypothetical protein [Bacillus safensis]
MKIKEDFWRRKIHLVKAVNNPFRLKAFEVSKKIIIKPVSDPTGYERRISSVMWTQRDKQTPGDQEKLNVYMANKVIKNGIWEINIYNASPDEVTVDVFGEQEENIGTVEIEL